MISHGCLLQVAGWDGWACPVGAAGGGQRLDRAGGGRGRLRLQLPTPRHQGDRDMDTQVYLFTISVLVENMYNVYCSVDSVCTLQCRY